MTNDSAVLVHCLAGVSRSVTVTLAYLMHTRIIHFEEAFALVRSRKSDISPNFHFLRQLHSFERQLFNSQNLNRSPISAQSTDSSYVAPDCETSIYSGNCGYGLLSTSSLLHHHQQQLHNHHLNYHPNVHQQLTHQHNYHHLQQQPQTEYLGTGVGVSPDSGIEFDRWTPADGTPK